GRGSLESSHLAHTTSCTPCSPRSTLLPTRRSSDLGHVNAHATSTVVGDVGEAAAIRKAIGDHPVVTAPKSALGHLVGGAGAVEAIVAILSIYHGIVPATLNLENLDPKVELDVVSGEARKIDLTAAI